MGIQCVDCVREAKAGQRALRSRLGFVVRQGPPVVTIALIVVNTVIFLYGESRSGDLFSEWGLWPHYSPSFPWLGSGDEWWRWISSGFVHGGVIHLGMNMLVLFWFGRPVEQLIGRARFIALYAGSLLGGSAAIVTFGSAGGVHGGASGAIYGVIAAYVVLSIRLKLPVGYLLAQAGAWLVVSLFYTGISWQGHMGGAAAGTLITLAFLAAARSRPGGAPPRGR